MVTTDEVSTPAVSDHSNSLSLHPKITHFSQNIGKPSSTLNVDGIPPLTCSMRNTDVLLLQHLPTSMGSLSVDLDEVSVMETSSASSDSPLEYASGRRKQPALNFHYMSTSEDEEQDIEQLDRPDSERSEDNSLDQKKTVKSRKVSQSSNKINQSSRFNRAHGSSALSVFARQRSQRAKLMAGLQAKNKKKVNGQIVDKTDAWSIGELVWARPYRPNSLPWWPAVIVQRPRKPRMNGLLKHKVQSKKARHLSVETATAPEHQVLEYYVYLLGPLQLSNSILLPQTRLRLFSGRVEYDTFLRETVLQADDKVKALRQFVVPTNLQNAWLLARDTAEAMRTIKPEPNGRLAIFPWANEARQGLLTTDRLRQQPPVARVLSRASQQQRQQAKKRARYRAGKRFRSTLQSSDTAGDTSISSGSSDSQSDSDNEEREMVMSDSDAESLYLLADQSRSPSCSTASADHHHQTAGRRGRRPAAASQQLVADAETPVAESAKDLASRFEYEKLRPITTQTRRLFVCSVCGSPGEQTMNSSSSGTAAAATTTTTTTIATADTRPEQESQSKAGSVVVVVACAGGCGNYLHPGCGQQVECGSSSSSSSSSSAKARGGGGAGTTAPSSAPLAPFDPTGEVQLEETTATAATLLDDEATAAGGGATTGAVDETGAPVGGNGVAQQQQHPGGGSGAGRLAYICSLCSAGLRQCFICNVTQKCPTLLRYQMATNTSTTENITVSSAQHDSVSYVKESPDGVPQSSGDSQRDTVVTGTRNCTGAPGDIEAKDVGENQLLRCSVKSCSRWYHADCLRRPPFSALVRERRATAFTCPAHACLSCAVENPGTLPRPAPRYIRCLICPAAYHPGEWCFPAGSREVAPNWIICPRHVAIHTESSLLSYAIPKELQVPKMSSALETMFRPTNVSWCFICSKGGRIICCETCPASFHEECLKIDEVPDKFICEDCTSGRFPRYGEIIWTRLPPHMNYFQGQSSAKVGILTSCSATAATTALTAGMYWWPAEIVHPRHLPESANPEKPPSQRSSVLGLFPTRLFGLTRPYDGDSQLCLPVILWTTKARLFPYEEGDDKRKANSSSDSSSSSSSSSEDMLDGEAENASGHRRQRRRRDQRQSLQRRRHNTSSHGDDGEDEDPLLQISSPTDLPVGLLSPTYSARTVLVRSAKSPDASARSTLVPTPPLHNTRRKRQHEEEGKSKSNRVPPDPALIRRRREVYASAVGQAAVGWLGRREKFASLLGRRRRPDYYKPIKTNLPLGNVRIYRVTDASEVPRCECNASGAQTGPCGPTSNCINRELHYECSPAVCPNGDKCHNQRFMKRLYPPQRPFWTGEERGWGLKTLVAIQEGEFVNEYIGDLIDEEEANRRLRFAHENNVTNYYMMKLDSQRIIDAGPKGNLSRFMNHSCDPNLNTQKWTVNGDNRIGLFAVRDIAEGEELTFNYNFVSLGQERLNCRCGASNCVGFLGAPLSTTLTTSGSCPASASTLSGSAGNGCAPTPSTGAQTIATAGTATPASVDGGPEATPGTKGRRRHSCSAATTGGGVGEEKAGSAATAAPGAGKPGGSQVAVAESASLPAARHETLCFRCHSSKPPGESKDRFGSATPLASGHQLKRRAALEGEQREDRLLSLPLSGGEQSSSQEAGAGGDRDVKRRQSSLTSAVGVDQDQEKPGGRLVQANELFTTAGHSLTDSEMVYCCKPDCSKVYHLDCLDLKSHPLGRWYCPWHHCDACGRPSHVFCGLCPASFCLAHVEGSVTVLPPKRTRRQLFSLRPSSRESTSVVARVVCMSHTDLISTGRGDEQPSASGYHQPASHRRRLSGGAGCSHFGQSADFTRCSIPTAVSQQSLSRVVAAEGSG